MLADVRAGLAASVRARIGLLPGLAHGQLLEGNLQTAAAFTSPPLLTDVGLMHVNKAFQRLISKSFLFK